LNVPDVAAVSDRALLGCRASGCSGERAIADLASSYGPGATIWQFCTYALL
jgi:hypothetical protein